MTLLKWGNQEETTKTYLLKAGQLVIAGPLEQGNSGDNQRWPPKTRRQATALSGWKMHRHRYLWKSSFTTSLDGTWDKTRAKRSNWTQPNPRKWNDIIIIITIYIYNIYNNIYILWYTLIYWNNYRPNLHVPDFMSRRNMPKLNWHIPCSMTFREQTSSSHGKIHHAINR